MLCRMDEKCAWQARLGLLLGLCMLVPPVSSVAYHVNQRGSVRPDVYWYEFTEACELHTYIITPRSCTNLTLSATGSTPDALGDIYVPRYIQRGAAHRYESESQTMEGVGDVVASNPVTADRTSMACVFYPDTGVPLYVFVRIRALLEAEGTFVVGMGDPAPSVWCMPA